MFSKNKKKEALNIRFLTERFPTERFLTEQIQKVATFISDRKIIVLMSQKNSKEFVYNTAISVQLKHSRSLPLSCSF